MTPNPKIGGRYWYIIADLRVVTVKVTEIIERRISSHASCDEIHGVNGPRNNYHHMNPADMFPDSEEGWRLAVAEAISRATTRKEEYRQKASMMEKREKILRKHLLDVMYDNSMQRHIVKSERGHHG